jgi:3-deoxy-D-manno-octulosonic-acid transferase
VALSTYRLLTRLAAPITPFLLRQRQRRGKEDPTRVGERMGRTERMRPSGGLVWFHAASVGETNATLPVIAAVHARRPDLTMLLTTGTTTSAKVAAERLAADEIHQFAPWDTPKFVERFLAHWQPDVLVLTESEIWPNLILDCHSRRIPIALINARMSERSRARWHKNRRFALPLFSRLELILAQNTSLVDDFAALGAADVRSVGNLKIDSPRLPLDAAAEAELRAAISDRPVWIAASTHPGEDEIVIAAHQRIASTHPELLTIIAPRHPERGADIAALAEAAPIRAAQRSTGALPDRDTEVYVADTIGELGMLYSIAPIALIGGSLVPHGGQNPIEAIRFDTAVITGPHTGNFTDAYDTLVETGGALCVTSSDALSDGVNSLLDNRDEADRLRKAAQTALNSLSGALDRTVDALIDLLPPPDNDGTHERAG